MLDMFTPTKSDPMGTMLSALTLMTLFFPLCRAIRNIMMGFLQWIGVDEEGVAGKAVTTLAALGAFARLAGSGWDTNVRTGTLPGLGKGLGGSSPGVVGGGKIPPVGGGGVVAEGGPGGIPGVGAIEGATGEEGPGGAPVAGPAVRMPGAGGVGGAAGGPSTEGPAGTGNVPPVPELAAIGGQGGPLRTPLERDVMDADRTGGIKFARMSAFFAPADHFAPGASSMYGAMWGNITAAGRLGVNMFRSISEIRKQHRGEGGRELTLGEAFKLYTRSRSVAGAAFKVGTVVAGTALGFGPPTVRRVQFAAEAPGRAWNYIKGMWKS
ncbi:hypothetical protein SAMN00808754_1476 [Thermanaeromonas toyohensis ToBE]|uniref:Uncharacterized protein n=1 Tax=Thermanaeromonas toyohensis ToBE TaxID=698762 RepID=A0A1W1VSZ5_9FIRM|nr:hypothetical protein [Thermanaeromonas toyohensis]SMB96393.1 hypothetical protein SAMN00808754_1476 [Thermanaeromonas toyohensis ToBE]